MSALEKVHYNHLFADTLHRQGESEKGNLIPLNRKLSMMQSFVDLEERLKDLTTDLQKMKEEFAGTISNTDGLSKEDATNMNRSFFDMLNGKSKNAETVL